MSPLVFLLIAVVLSAAGGAVIWLRHRSPTSYDSGIKAFQREMQALAPSEEDDGQVGRWRKGRGQ